MLQKNKSQILEMELLDLSTNDNLRKIFFQQIENLDFNYTKINDREYIITTSLDDSIDTSTKVLSHRFDTVELALIQQYGIHKIYIPSKYTYEYNVCVHLAEYLHKSNKNSHKAKDSKSLESMEIVHGLRCSKDYQCSLEFEFNEPIQQDLTYTMSIIYKNNDIVAIDNNGSSSFLVLDSWKDVSIKTMITYDRDSPSQKCVKLYMSLDPGLHSDIDLNGFKAVRKGF